MPGVCSKTGAALLHAAAIAGDYIDGQGIILNKRGWAHLGYCSMRTIQRYQEPLVELGLLKISPLGEDFDGSPLRHPGSGRLCRWSRRYVVVTFELAEIISLDEHRQKVNARKQEQTAAKRARTHRQAPRAGRPNTSASIAD